MLRASSYTIYVDLPESPDEMLLVHGYTGAYDRVSRRVANYVRSLDPEPPPRPLYGAWVSEPAVQTPGPAEPPSERTLETLRRRGYLTPMSRQEEEGYFARVVKKVHRRSLQHAPGYIVMPTYQCNLRCPYCFQDHMRTRPELAHLLRTMTTEMADRIVASWPEIEANHGIEPDDEVTRQVGFYGGEPLLAANRALIEHMMRRVRDIGPVRFWGVSNATELEAYADLLGPDGISQLQITLDGPPAEHDRRRIRADGTGTFEQIARNIDLCLDRGVIVNVRMNLDRMNVVQVPFLAEEIVERGWDRRTNFSVYTAPVHAGNASVDQGTTFSSWELDQAIDELRAIHPPMQVIGRPDDVMEGRARRLFDTRADAVPQFRASFCGAHTTMYIFDAFGDVYACWERTGDPEVRIGRVLPEGGLEVQGALAKRWRSRTVASNPTCRRCRYSMQCGGGCAVLAEAHTGRFFNNFCDGFGERFRHSVAQAYAGFVQGVEVAHHERVCDL